MKKVYDWNIQLFVHIQNTNQTISIICSVHTNIHALKIQICKKMGYAPFDTEMDLYGGSSAWKSMKPTSSLQQNGIQKSGTKIKAIIKRVKQNQGLKVQIKNGLTLDKKFKENNVNAEDSGYGLSLQAACTNMNCVNYQQSIQINYGYGDFALFHLISSLKCEICPYKSQNLRPSMMCTAVKAQKCLYKMSGTVPDRDHLPIDKSTGYLKCMKSKNIFEKVRQNPWNSDLILSIKHF